MLSVDLHWCCKDRKLLSYDHVREIVLTTCQNHDFSEISNMKNSHQMKAWKTAINARIFARGKRTKAGTATQGTQRVIGQLSVLSASRKQPKVLKLSNEDLVRHQVVSNAWSLVQKQKRVQLEKKLELQYAGLRDAMADLEQVNNYLFRNSNKQEKSKRFSLELRVPTEYPPNEVWEHKYD